MPSDAEMPSKSTSGRDGIGERMEREGRWKWKQGTWENEEGKRNVKITEKENENETEKERKENVSREPLKGNSTSV